MSWLRASRKVVDPDGVKWDIYVTRIHVRDPGDLFDVPDGMQHGRSYTGFWPFELVPTIANAIVRLFVRVVMLLPFALVRSRFGMTRRIEAIAEWPHPIRRVWQVEGPPGRVLLDEIASGIESGKPPRPAGARYLGEET
ncbi:MAG: hypothetical protein ABI317_16655 [Gaiellales bacterium]